MTATLERTLVIIKPDGVKRKLVGRICSLFEEFNLLLVSVHTTKISHDEAEIFYTEHRTKSFFSSLALYLSSGPITTLTLEGANAVRRLRRLVGNTQPMIAKPGTIRSLFGENILLNTVHSSDGTASAKRELNFFHQQRTNSTLGCD